MTTKQKVFAYVRASAPMHDKTLIGFEHTFIEADDQSEAYSVGLAWSNKTPLDEGFVILNDYAFEAQS
jgi:hypothetical protein